MKRALRLVIATAFATVAAICCLACAGGGEKPIPSECATFKNVIVVIGDGTGFNHIADTKAYFSMPSQPFETTVLRSRTRSRNSEITDSAAGATAIACGQRVDNGNVARLGAGGENLKSLSEYAHEKNKKVGIVTTDELSGATPAAFSSHANNRGDTSDIIDGQLALSAELMIGKDSAAYSVRRADFENAGYLYCGTKESLSAVTADKVIACLPSFHAPYNVSNPHSAVRLTDMVRYAIDFLDCDNGFFLMVESAYIDKYSHENRFFPMVHEAQDFIDMVNYLFSATGNDTAIIVTADHETGGLQIGKDGGDGLFTTGGHTAEDVPVYLKNLSFANSPSIVDNTDLFDLALSAM